MIIVMLLASNARVMGNFTISLRLKLFGWAATAVMITAAIGLFATWGRT
jgi:Mn2+/Fe2+ NRAMP family transporter